MGQKSFLSCLTAEPAVFLYSFNIFIYGTVVQNLIQQKVCSPDSVPFTDFVCNDSSLLASATDIVTTRSTLRETLPAIILLLAGCWRDLTSLNKPILYLALIGEITGVCIELFAVLNWTTSSWATSVTDAIISGLAGGGKLFYMGANCVITDSSRPEERTARFTLIVAATSGGGCLGTVLSGYILSFLGYKWFLISVISIHLITFALVLFIKENERKQVKVGKWQTFKKLKSIFKSRPNNTVIWLMIVCSCVINEACVAEGIVYNYYLEQGFGFTLEEAGIYVAYRLVICSLSSVVLPSILTKVFKLSDFKVGFVSAALTVISGISMFLAKTRLELALFAFLDILKVFLITVPKSIMTKCVHINEIGVYLSLCSIAECILPFAMFYIYDCIFSATSETSPGAFFVASSAFAAITLIIFSTSPFIYKPPVNDSSEECKNPEKDLEKCETNSKKPIEALEKPLENKGEGKANFPKFIIP